MMPRWLIGTTLSAGMVLSVGRAAAHAADVDEIVHKAYVASYYAAADGRASARMVITDSQGRRRERELVILRWDRDDGGEQKYYVYFRNPPDVKGMVFMVHKHVDRDDDRWLYLPALDLVRRIAASDKRSSFAGSDFVYEDVSGRAPRLDAFSFVEENEKAYVLKAVPRDKTGVEFASYQAWIDKTTYLPIKIEYYDEHGRLIRLIETLDVQVIEGHPTVTRSRASDRRSGSQTILEFSDVDYDIGLDERIFTERYLRRPPLRWIR